MPQRVGQMMGLMASAVAALAATAAPASAAGYTCEASAVRGAVLTVPPVEPITANKGASTCRAATAGGSLNLPIAVNALALGAQTTLEGPEGTPSRQTAGAVGGATDLRVRTLPDLPIQLPLDQVTQNIPPLTVELPGGLGSATVDLKTAVQAALPDGRLPNLDLVRVRAASAFAQARCVGGRPELTGSSQVAGVQVLGQDLPLNEVVTRAVEVVGGQEIDPSKLNPTVTLPAGITLQTPLVSDAIQQALDAAPNIQIPAAVAQIRVTPGAQERTATRLTQRALSVSVSVLGTQLVDLTIGEASVGQDADTCAAASQGVAQQALECTTRRLVLIDVLPGRRRVQLYGAADQRYVGRRVSIFFTANGRRVARATVRRDGTFRASARMPSRKIRGTNRARYQARIGRERSLRLKLQRRMLVRSVRVRGNRVRIAGRVVRPLARPIRRIVVKRRVSCRRNEVVARIKPSRKGNFNVTVPAPPGALAAVYRFETRVRNNRSNPKTYPTFTLPRYVDLGRS